MGDFGILVLLTLVTSVAWCVATGKGTSSPWNLPTTYADPVYSDFIGNCGGLRSLKGWSALPFGRKVSPDLGAPDVVNWNVAVSADEVRRAWFGLLTRTFGLFAGFNVAILVGHIAAAVTLYLVARTWLQIQPLWSFVAALVFGLAPYLFAESPHHPNCQYCWHLPLFPMVWTWVATEPGLQWRSRRLWQAVGIGFLTGFLDPYYTFIFCQLVLLGGGWLAWRQRSWMALACAVTVTAAAAASFFLSDIDTILYRLTQPAGEAPLLAHREYKWMDIYGFKMVDMFIPWITHHSDTFAKFGLSHRQASVLNDEEGCAYLGLIGIGCLLFLVATAVRRMADGRAKDVPPEAWWVLWIVLFFNTGGLNSLIAAFTGFSLFRTGIRYSVVVLVLALLYAARRISAWQRNAAARQPADLLRIGTSSAAVFACAVILWDQVPRSPAAERTAAISNLVESDRRFVGELETRLPSRAMIFQLPVMDGTSVPGVTSSDHYRPYLYSTSLHWSHGALPGSRTLRWQQEVQQRLVDGAAIDQQGQQVRFNIGNVRRAVDELRAKGFAAIYINRNGFPDRGKGLFDALLELGYDTPAIYSPAGDLACVVLGDAAPTSRKAAP